MSKQTTGRLALVLIVVLAALSLASLLNFPDSFDDEGFYAAYGKGFVESGHFSSPSIQSVGPFALGNAWLSRINATIFGALGFKLGHTITLARAIAFCLVWGAALVWAGIGQALGISPLVAALFFVCNERVFYASHVFRPESTLVLVNTLFVAWVVRDSRRDLSAADGFWRGFSNAAFVLAHGTGLVSGVLNTLDWISLRAPNHRERFKRVGAYAGASFVAVLLYYLVQVRDAGGWGIAQAQMAMLKQYHIEFSLWDSVVRDLKLRWGSELVTVGGSAAAKMLRWVFYGNMLGASLLCVVRGSGLQRRLGLLSIGSVLGYMFLVADKIDIQLAELIPFFLAAFLAWFSKARLGGAREQRLSRLAAALVVLSGFCLCAHHAIKYRQFSHSRRQADAIARYLESGEQVSRSLGQRTTLVANMNLWFYFHDRLRFIGARFFNDFLPLSGRIIAADGVENNEFLKKCVLTYRDPAGEFRVFDCPALQ